MIRSFTPATPRPTPENYYVSLNDMLVGILFLFVLLLTTYALNFKAKEDRVSKLYKERVEQRRALVAGLHDFLKLPRRPSAEAQEGILRFDESALFANGEAVLKPEGRVLLRRLGARLEQELPCYVDAADFPCRTATGRHPILEALYVEGHTDSKPFAGRGGNWGLSSDRAIAAYRALTGAVDNSPHPRLLERLKNAGGHENLVGISAYADRRKIYPDHDAPNRRVDLRFILAAPEDSDAVAPRAVRKPG